ncbi:uncharacterized protein TNCV_5130751 [Trichonephila clavipes]|nr:uncharacterized protein TNCV_5130751 [Trichonephila clavipes]
MSSSKVRKWVRAFKDGRENVHDEPRSGQPSVITDDLVNAVDEKIHEDRLLTEEHKLKRMACALDFLDRYHKEGDQFLERIVTGDATWVSHITPESKRQSMEWRHTNSPVRVKTKRTISTRKGYGNRVLG